MKITFNNTEFNSDFQNVSSTDTRLAHSFISNKQSEKADLLKSGVRLDMNNGKNGVFSELLPAGKSGKTLTELQMEAGNIDVGVSLDYQIVLSNTLSAEDYAKAQKEGFDFGAMNAEDVVTIQDRVKAEIAKGGEIIRGYNDNLSDETLEAAVGSKNLAQSIEAEFAKEDLPITEENTEEIVRAWDMAKNLKVPSEANISYMIENEMNPTVWNFYLAENSGAAFAASSGQNSTQISGVDAINSIDANRVFSLPENQGIEKQIRNMLEAGGYVSEDIANEKMKDAAWLLSKNLPVTNDSIVRLNDIKSVAFPITEDAFAASVAASLSYGDTPVYADLSKTENVYKIANDVFDKYFGEDVWNMTAGDITSRRQLEEVRLSMTAEVNVKLLRSGFSFDTAPMEELIDALKKAEVQIANNYFGDYKDNAEDAVNSYRLLNEAIKVADETATLPASTLGLFTARNADDVSLREFHAEGIIRKDTYVKAEESYEALMTSPRADLGDSIKKAFGNVPELLENIGFEATAENQRAARILGYNHMEITADNMERIVSADKMVQEVVSNMTPASVLRMIRDGVNPLETSFEALNKYFEDYKDAGFESGIKEYSEFLYALDMSDSITAGERESYIGIYRMLHQIDKSGGAAIGAVVNEQAELGFANLISAVRSGKFGGMDIRVDENFGGTGDIIRAAKSITQQIETAFIGSRTDIESEDIRKAADTDVKTVQMMNDYSIEATANNMIAATELLAEENNLFEYLTGRDRNKNEADIEKTKNEYKAISDKIEDSMGSDDFENIVKECDDKMTEMSENLAMNASSYVDVKAYALLNRQLSIMSKINSGAGAAGEKDYIVPFMIDGEISKVHLSFKNGVGSSNLDISVSMEESVIEAHLQLVNGKIEGYFTGNTSSVLKKLSDISDIFSESLKNAFGPDEPKIGNIPVIEKNTSEVNSSKFDNLQSKDAEVYNSEGTERKTLLQISKIFLQSVRTV